jgi:hypothetical protein
LQVARLEVSHDKRPVDSLDSPIESGHVADVELNDANDGAMVGGVAAAKLIELANLDALQPLEVDDALWQAPTPYGIGDCRAIVGMHADDVGAKAAPRFGAG